MVIEIQAAGDGKICDPKELVELVKAGDLEALDRITRCHGQRLLAVGRRYCRDGSMAEDAVQDALISAGTHLSDFRGDGSLEGWLIRMVRNACHHMRRGRKNDPFLHDAEAILQSDDADPEQKAMVGELATTLGDALLELDPLNRSIVLLSESEGYSAAEIGEHVGISAGAVRVRLHRARKRLQERLEPLAGEHGLA